MGHMLSQPVQGPVIVNPGYSNGTVDTSTVVVQRDEGHPFLKFLAVVFVILVIGVVVMAAVGV